MAINPLDAQTLPADETPELEANHVEAEQVLRPLEVNLPNPSQEDPRSLAYFSALVDGWINTKMERDKQVLTLASLGLGGLITFTEKLETTSQYVLWFSASILFLTSILGALLIFKQNGSLIEKLINNAHADGADAVLKILDIIVMSTFYIGVCITFVFAVVRADFSIVKNETNVIGVEHVKQISN